MLIIVISWNRPKLLRKTLDSLFWCTRPHDKVVVVDNGSDEDTLLVASDERLFDSIFLETNVGINQAIEAALDAHLGRHDYVMVTDGDMLYLKEFDLAQAYLDAHPRCNALSWCDAIEHEAYEIEEWQGHQWKHKKAERGGSLILRSSCMKRLRPLPFTMIDFDWHVFRDSPNHIEHCVVMPGGAHHLGWNVSTWAGRIIPEHVYL